MSAEERRAKKREYYAAHREHYSEYGRRWRAEHPDYHRQWLARQNELAKE
ncbi:MAG: hypothetical protein IJG80_02870 [Selenomonadaceae bacterium]|nr:hypothetical protein [Selenomonadaceae bacterium]